MKQIVFTGGGTGGHVYPAIAVYRALPADLISRVSWIGSHRGVERDIVTAEGIPYHSISTGKLRRYVDLQNVLDIFRVLAGVFQALIYLSRRPVGVVFSKGGFVAVPVVLAARILRIPVIIHESDGDPGLATRITARFAQQICLAYRDTAEQFAPTLQERVVISGNPVREEFYSASAEGVLRRLGLDETESPVILVTGGSLGALQLNRWVQELAPALTREVLLIHQTGEHGAALIPEITAAAQQGRYFGAATFTTEFPALLRRADIVVARAGAGTIWEIAAAERPAILVPLSLSASRGDQIRNASRYAAAGAAEVLDDPDATAACFHALLQQLLNDPGRRNAMSVAARAFGGGNGAVMIAEMIAAVVGETEFRVL